MREASVLASRSNRAASPKSSTCNRAVGGRMQVLQRAGMVWKPIACIELPSSVKFEDYAAVSVRGRRIAVISQQTSRLWVRTLKFGDWTVRDPGTIYDFPRTKTGHLRYCTLEGLCWLSARSFVLVSDLSAQDAGRRCRKRDQSIHVFRIPTKVPAPSSKPLS